MQIHIRDAPPGKKTAQEPHGEHRPQPYVDVEGTRVSRMRAHSLIMHLERPAELARPAQLPPQHRQTTLRPAAAGLPRAAPLLPSGPLPLWRRGFRRAARAAAQEAAELCGEAFGAGAVGRESRLQRLQREEVRVEQRLEEPLRPPPLQQQRRELRLRVLEIAQRLPRAAQREAAERGAVRRRDGDGDGAAGERPLVEEERRAVLLVVRHEPRGGGGENHQLREHASGGELGPEALVEGGGGGEVRVEEAGVEEEEEVVEAAGDAADVQQPDSGQGGPRERPRRASSDGWGEGVRVPEQHDQLECGEHRQHQECEHHVDHPGDGSPGE
mmetsp:Transcript_2624/g.8612  ORF Transcript_2624/g.8612 Transcript_2624/m.8612 type:complete len:328 (-) Transcript_2624:645-1628(-)